MSSLDGVMIEGRYHMQVRVFYGGTLRNPRGRLTPDLPGVFV